MSGLILPWDVPRPGQAWQPDWRALLASLGTAGGHLLRTGTGHLSKCPGDCCPAPLSLDILSASSYGQVDCCDWISGTYMLTQDPEDECHYEATLTFARDPEDPDEPCDNEFYCASQVIEGVTYWYLPGILGIDVYTRRQTIVGPDIVFVPGIRVDVGVIWQVSYKNFVGDICRALLEAAGNGYVWETDTCDPDDLELTFSRTNNPPCAIPSIELTLA